MVALAACSSGMGKPVRAIYDFPAGTRMARYAGIRAEGKQYPVALRSLEGSELTALRVSRLFSRAGLLPLNAFLASLLSSKFEPHVAREYERNEQNNDGNGQDCENFH